MIVFTYALLTISFAVILRLLAGVLWSLNRERLRRKRNARIAAMLEYRHVWKEARHRVINNTR